MIGETALGEIGIRGWVQAHNYLMPIQESAEWFVKI